MGESNATVRSFLISSGEPRVKWEGMYVDYERHAGLPVRLFEEELAHLWQVMCKGAGLLALLSARRRED